MLETQLHDMLHLHKWQTEKRGWKASSTEVLSMRVGEVEPLLLALIWHALQGQYITMLDYSEGKRPPHAVVQAGGVHCNRLHGMAHYGLLLKSLRPDTALHM